MSELFSKQQWTGTFFPPSAYEDRFYGEINYSPEEGVILSYHMVKDLSPSLSLAEVEVLHGYLSNGDRCTLVGHFNLLRGKPVFHENMTILSNKARFDLLAIGDFLDEDEKFSNVNFSLTNLQEFFSPNNAEKAVEHSEDPLCTIATEFGEMQVRTIGEFNPIRMDVASRIHRSNQEASDKFSQALQDIRREFPDEFSQLKQDVAYRIFLNFLPKIAFNDVYQHILNLSELFALLFCKPVYPNSITIRKPSESNPSNGIKIYPSRALNQRTIDLITRPLSSTGMPITKFTMPFERIVDNWLRLETRPDIMVSIQTDTGLRDRHTTYGDIVIYSAQLEAISYNDDQTDKKYEYPLTEFANKGIRDRLMDIFEKSSLGDVGQAIGELRNEIVHLGRSRRWLKKLSFYQLMEISTYLQLIVFRHILISIGIPKEVASNYQYYFSPEV